MARMYFHSEHGEAEVRGSERAWGGMLADHTLQMILLDSVLDESRVLGAMKKVLKTEKSYGFENIKNLKTLLSVGAMMGDTHFVIDGERVDLWDTALNTALVYGSNPVRLLARLHGQCEIWAWVDGSNRAWLAGIIREGRESGIMRAEAGWESVIDLLLSRDDGPVVTSYSVTDQFPCLEMAIHGGYEVSETEDGDMDTDEWWELPHSQRWELAMVGLKSKRLMEMTPDNWESYRFGAGYTAFDVLREMYKEVVK